MTDCQIFTTFVAAQRIWDEIEVLFDEFSSGLKSYSTGDITLETTKWLDANDAEDPPNGVNYWCNSTVKLRSKGRGPARSRLLTLYFDLARDLISEEQADWPHAREALLVVGFDPNRARNGWDHFAAVAPDGRLRDKDTWDDCKNNAFADDRLLEWKRYSVSDGGWSHRAWLLALPLRRLINADAVAEQLTKPIVVCVTQPVPGPSLAIRVAVIHRELVAQNGL
jgi:hypothetical protein